MLNFRKISVITFFSIYFLTGVYLSITNGISHDQFHEQLNWKINFNAIKGIIENDNRYEELLNYKDKYHGIGFHYFSQPIQLLSNEFVGKLNNVNLEYAHYISRHLAIFIIFFVSGIFFYLLSFKISKDKNFSLIATIIYFFYPYLFGHAQINGKDIPFLSLWLICTYYLFLIVEDLFNGKKNSFKNIILISLFTAFLVSIRITGILVLLEYLIAIIILVNIKKIDALKFIFENIFHFIIFILSLIFFIYILNPILWLDIREFFNAINWMGKYYHDICTLTLGECMSALNLSPTYFFIWLFFKLPILVLAGLFMYPLIEKKIFNKGIITIYYGTLGLTLIFILFIFIFKNVALYDEIRHIMFLIPLIFIISFYNIFIFSRKVFYSLSILLLFFFIFENISLKKYQYTWLNSFAKFTQIEKNFETDYLGISNKNLQKEIINYSKKHSLNKDICVYGGIYNGAYLEKFNFLCFKSYSELDAAKLRPFFAYQNVRNLKRSNPKDCKLIFDESYNYTFSKQKVSVGKLWYCD
tara:strand:- start:282 stop:1865 length:1584 start_codon:yes stop_codon:yes gene_type:complete